MCTQMMLSKLFFFSSRRRHTRYWRDWSSDVCSSDLSRSVDSNLSVSHNEKHQEQLKIIVSECLKTSEELRLEHIWTRFQSFNQFQKFFLILWHRTSYGVYI